MRMLIKRQDRGLPTPALDDAPMLFPTNEIVWRAFSELHPSRPCNFNGQSGLLTSEILSWFNINGITVVDDTRELYKLILHLDNTWLNWAKEETQKDK